MSPRQAPVLEPDLEAGLKRLKLAAVRRMAPEVLRTARIQRWPPEELLRSFVEAEIAARDASNERARRKAAGFPVRRTLENFDLSESSVPRATFEHLASLDWIPDRLPDDHRPYRGRRAAGRSCPSLRGPPP